MAAVQHIALAGATGHLGPSILKALLQSGFKVTVLTRHNSKSAASLSLHDNQTIKEVDYNSTESLASALKGVDVAISSLSSARAEEQKKLIEAAVSVGVRRFLPSEFGSDSTHANNVNIPAFAGKVAVQKFLKEKVASNPAFSYTLVFTNPFWDFCVHEGILINAKEHTAVLGNGGDVPISVTRVPTVAKAVVGVLRNLEATRNRAVYVHEAVVTQKQMIEIVKDIDGQEWSTTVKDTEDIVKEAQQEMKRDKPDIRKAMIGFISQAIFGKNNGTDFSGKVDNKLLGIEELDGKGVERVMREIVVG